MAADTRELVPEAMFERHLDDIVTTLPCPGRFAVRRPDSNEIDFFKVSRPTYGSMKHCWVVKFQLSDLWHDGMVVWPSDTPQYMRHWKNINMKGAQYLNPRIRRVLLDAVTDWEAAAMLYGEIMQKCMRCGKKLTDGESRWYGIGPECKGYWSGTFMRVVMTKGFYEHSELEL